MALPPSKDLSGRVALITGGISGIGKGIALELARRGADVAVTYTSESKDEFAHGTVNELNLSRPGARAISIRADLRKVTAHQYIVKETLEKLETDHIDILVHNAGIMHIGATTDETQETFTNLFDTNVRGPYFLTQAVLAHVPKGGRIILISSTSARVASMGSAMALYSATKAALECFARTWAYEFGARGITVNAVEPGLTETEKTQDMQSDTMNLIRENYAKITPFGRSGTPDDVAQIVAFLASEGSRWVTGSTITASGGRVLI